MAHATNGRDRDAGAGAPSIAAKNLSSDDRRFLDRHGGKLSKTTLRAKWTHSSDEHQDRPGQTLATRDGDVIRAWAEERKAQPATARSRDAHGRPRTLRFDLPDYGDRSLERIDWDAWLSTFKERDLVFLYQEQLRDGRQSNFFRLDNPTRDEG